MISLVRESRTMHTCAPAAAASMRLKPGHALSMGSMPMRLAATSGQTAAGRAIPGARRRMPVCVMVLGSGHGPVEVASRDLQLV